MKSRYDEIDDNDDEDAEHCDLCTMPTSAYDRAALACYSMTEGLLAVGLTQEQVKQARPHLVGELIKLTVDVEVSAELSKFLQVMKEEVGKPL